MAFFRTCCAVWLRNVQGHVCPLLAFFLSGKPHFLPPTTPHKSLLHTPTAHSPSVPPSRHPSRSPSCPPSVPSSPLGTGGRYKVAPKLFAATRAALDLHIGFSSRVFPISPNPFSYNTFTTSARNSAGFPARTEYLEDSK